MTTQLISDHDVKQYQRDGVICIRNLFSKDIIDEVEAGIAKNRAHPGPSAESLTEGDEQAAFFDDYCNWQRIDEYHNFIFNSSAGMVAGQLMGANTVRFYHEHVLVKDAGTSKRTPWHHDLPYYPLKGDQVCSFWVPIDPVQQKNCPRFVRGSHAWGKWFVPRKFATDSNYQWSDSKSAWQSPCPIETVPDIEKHCPPEDLLAWDLEPGDAIAFHMLTVHGGPGSDSARQAIATRWVGDEVFWDDRPWEVSPPLNGEEVMGAAFSGESFPVVWSTQEAQ